MSDWSKKVVLIAGGSSGLGRHLATAFGKRGATVVLWARDQGRMDTTCQELSDAGLSALGMSVDVCSDDEVSQAIEAIKSQFGRLDALVNAVGLSTRSSMLETSLADYREFMAVNFESAVRCSLACIDLLTESKGHLVNIGSLSSKTAWPFMAPYTTSKMALAGFTQQLRLEGPRELHVMLVCPGPIQRTDAGQRYQGQMNGLPEEAAKPGGGAPVKGLDPQKLAERIVRGCERRSPEIVQPSWLKLLFCTSQCSAKLGDWILRRASRTQRDA